MPNLLVQLVQPVQQCTGATSAFSPIQWIHINWNTHYCVQTGRQVGTTVQPVQSVQSVQLMQPVQLVYLTHSDAVQSSHISQNTDFHVLDWYPAWCNRCSWCNRCRLMQLMQSDCYKQVLELNVQFRPKRA